MNIDVNVIPIIVYLPYSHISMYSAIYTKIPSGSLGATTVIESGPIHVDATNVVPSGSMLSDSMLSSSSAPEVAAWCCGYDITPKNKRQAEGILKIFGKNPIAAETSRIIKVGGISFQIIYRSFIFNKKTYTPQIKVEQKKTENGKIIIAFQVQYFDALQKILSDILVTSLLRN